MAELRVGVVGAGTMGAGIAELACVGGYETLLFDPDPEALAQGAARVEDALERGVERGRLSSDDAAHARVRLGTAEELELLAGLGLVIEAAPEDLALKRELFGRLEGICGPEAVLATNTS